MGYGNRSVSYDTFEIKGLNFSRRVNTDSKNKVSKITKSICLLIYLNIFLLGDTHKSLQNLFVQRFMIKMTVIVLRKF